MAFKPNVLRERAAALASDPDNYYHQGSFTIHIEDQQLTKATGPFSESGRARDFVNLIRPIAAHLPVGFEPGAASAPRTMFKD